MNRADYALVAIAVAALLMIGVPIIASAEIQFAFAQVTNSTFTNSTLTTTNSTLTITNSTSTTSTNSTSTTTTSPEPTVEEIFTIFQYQQQEQSFPIISQPPSVDLSDLVYETYTDDFIIRSYQNYDEIIDLNERVVKVVSTPLRINIGDSWGYIKSWEDINNLYVQSIKGAITLDKNACAFTMYNGLEILPSNIELGSISWTPKYAQVGTDDWIVIDELNDAQCTVISEQIDDYNLVLTLTKDTSNFRLEHLIEINSFEGIKETYRIFNDNPLLTNHKFSATQTIHVPNTITVPMIIPDELTTIELPYSEDYDFTSDAIKSVTLVPEVTTEIITTNGTQTTTIPQFYEVEYTPYIATSQTFDIESLSFDGVYLDRNWIIDNHLMILGFGEYLSYDIEKGLDQLWSINLFNENSIPKVSLDYANNAQLIPVGGVFEVDPTFYNSYSTASTTPTQVSVPVGVDVSFKVWGAGGGSGRNGGGGGGGYSGIFSSSTISQANAIVIGGSGGGGSSCDQTSVSFTYGSGCGAGGSGGGTTAMAGYDSTYYYGGAGSQTAGGTPHSYSGGGGGAGTALGGGAGSNTFSVNKSNWGGGVGGAGGYINGVIDTTNLPEANLYVLVGGGGGAGGTSGSYSGGAGGVNGGGAGGLSAGGGGAGYYGGAGGGSDCCGGYGTGGGGSNFYNTNFVTLGDNLIGGVGKANTARTNADLYGQLATIPPSTADSDWSNNGGAGGGYTGTASNGYDGLVVLSYSYAEAPDPPTNFTANDGSPVSITYSAPAYDGGASVYGYNIYRGNVFSGIALPDNGGTNGGLDFTDNELLLHDFVLNQPTTVNAYQQIIGYNGGSGGTGFFTSSPTGVLVDSNGDIFGVDRYGQRILKWDSSGTHIGTFAISGTTYPAHIKEDSQGNYWVTATNANQFRKYSPTFTLLNTYSGGTYPYGLAIDKDDNVWITNQGNLDLRKYSPNGTLLLTITGIGSGTNGGALDIKYHDDHIWVANRTQNKIMKYDLSGNLVFEFSSCTTPMGVHITPTDDIVVSCTGTNTINTYDSSGTFVSSFGSSGSGNGQFNSPRNISMDSDGYLYVVEEGNSRIQKFGLIVYITEVIDSSPNTLTVTPNRGTTTAGVFGTAVSAPDLEVTSSLLPDGTDSFTVGSWVKQSGPLPDFEDNFSADDWTDSDSAKMGVQSGYLYAYGQRDGTNDSSSRSLGTTLNGNFVFRTQVDITSWSTGAVGYGKGVIVGLSDQPNTSSDSTSQDSVAIRISARDTNGDGFYATWSDNQAMSAGGSTRIGSLAISAGILYFEIIKDGTTVTYNIYSDSDYSTLVATVNQTSVTATGFTYAVVRNENATASTQSGYVEADIDDWIVYDGVTSVPTTPTNTKLFGFTNSNGEEKVFNVGTTTADFSEIIGTSWDIDTATKFDTVGSTYPITGSGGTFTWSFWWKPDSLCSGSCFFIDRLFPTSGTYSPRITQGGSGNVVVTSTTNGVGYGGTAGTTNTMTLNQWNHIVVKQSGSTLTVILNDGTPASTTTISGNDSGDNWRFSYYAGMSGYLDNAVMYSTALSSSDITALYNSGVPTTSAGAGVTNNILIEHDFNSMTLTNSGSLGGTGTILAGNPSLSIEGNTIISATGLTDNTSDFQHYALTRDGSNWTIYQNGASVATATDSTDLGTVSGSHKINIDGAIDEYFIDSTGLTSNEIQTVYNMGADPTQIATTGTTPSYNDNSGNAGDSYYYYVKTTTDVGDSQTFSTSALGIFTSPANAPTNLVASTNQLGQIVLDWTPSSNLGNGSLISMEIQRDDGNGWQTIAITQNTSPPYTDTTTVYGQTYDYRVASVNQAGTGAWSNTATATAGVPPDAIVDLSGSIPDPSNNPQEVQLIFNEPISWGTGAPTSYEIYESPSGLPNTWTQVANPNYIAGQFTTIVNISSLSPLTDYYYMVRAVSSHGTSLDSNVISVTTPNVPDLVPSVTASLDDPDNAPLDVHVSWVQPNNGGSEIKGYQIERHDDVSNTWSTLVANTALPATDYQDTTVQPDVTYKYRVSAINPLGTGATSPESNTVLTPTIPDSPTGLAVTALSDTQLQLDYVTPIFDGRSALQGYTIELENPPNTWTQVASTPNTTYTYTGTVSTEYNFRVSAYNNVGSSNPSSNASGWTLASAPTNLVASTVSGDTINLTFDTPAHTVTDYKVYKETPIGNGFALDQTVAYATACTPSCSIDVSGDSGLNYNTYIVAVNLGGDSTASNQANAWTLSDPPNNIVLTSNPNTATQVTIDWDAPTPDAVTGYLIERNDGNGWVVVNANTQSQATIIVDTGLQLSTTYEYRIATINLGGTGLYSTTSSITTYSPPDPPIGISFDLQKVPVGSNDDLRIKLTWDMTGVNLYSGTVQGYKIERNVDNAGWTVLTANTGTTGLSATDTGLSRSSVYQYRVSTITQIATGSPSNAFQAEFLDGEIVWQLIPVEGNTIRGEISFDETNGLPNGYAQSLLIVQHDNSNQAITTAVQTVNYVNATLPQGFELDGLTTLPDFYVYDIGGYNYTAYVTTTQDGMTHIFESGILFASPTNAFGGQIFADEYRDQTSYTNSTLSVRAQPADFDYVVRYQHQNPNIEPQFFAFNGIEANNTSTAPVLPNSDYYVSVFVNPTEFDYTIVDPTTGEAEIECNENSPKTCPAWTSIRTPNGEVTYHLNESYGAIENIPSGIESDYTLRSFKSPDSPVQLGLEPMGDLFGMPMVFIFIIALGAVFTGRSAQMGVVFIVATIGLMVYMGYLSFDFGTNGLSEAITWGLIVVAMILGVLVGKRWS